MYHHVSKSNRRADKGTPLEHGPAASSADSIPTYTNATLASVPLTSRDLVPAPQVPTQQALAPAPSSEAPQGLPESVATLLQQFTDTAASQPHYWDHAFLMVGAFPRGKFIDLLPRVYFVTADGDQGEHWAVGHWGNHVSMGIMDKAVTEFGDLSLDDSGPLPHVLWVHASRTDGPTVRPDGGVDLDVTFWFRPFPELTHKDLNQVDFARFCADQ